MAKNIHESEITSAMALSLGMPSEDVRSLDEQISLNYGSQIITTFGSGLVSTVIANTELPPQIKIGVIGVLGVAVVAQTTQSWRWRRHARNLGEIFEGFPRDTQQFLSSIKSSTGPVARSLWTCYEDQFAVGQSLKGLQSVTAQSSPGNSRMVIRLDQRKDREEGEPSPVSIVFNTKHVIPEAAQIFFGTTDHPQSTTLIFRPVERDDSKKVRPESIPVDKQHLALLTSTEADDDCHMNACYAVTLQLESGSYDVYAFHQGQRPNKTPQGVRSQPEQVDGSHVGGGQRIRRRRRGVDETISLQMQFPDSTSEVMGRYLELLPDGDSSERRILDEDDRRALRGIVSQRVLEALGQFESFPDDLTSLDVCNLFNKLRKSSIVDDSFAACVRNGVAFGGSGRNYHNRYLLVGAFVVAIMKSDQQIPKLASLKRKEKLYWREIMIELAQESYDQLAKMKECAMSGQEIDMKTVNLLTRLLGQASKNHHIISRKHASS